jgi:hypothetical protein
MSKVTIKNKGILETNNSLMKLILFKHLILKYVLTANKYMA